MKFAHLEMLFLIWVVPVLGLLFLYGLRRRRSILKRFAFPARHATLAPGADAKRRRIRAGLVTAAALLMVLALTGPQYGYRWEEIERRGVDIIIALDCSRSMLAEDIPPSRLERAKREIRDLTNRMQGDRVGLVAFAGTAFVQCPLTLDYDAFHIFLDVLSPDFLPLGGSDIHVAIQTAMSAFDPEDNTEKAVILITDGEPTGADPLTAAETARGADVKLFCIGVGRDVGVPIPTVGGGFAKDPTGKIVMTRLDEDLLKRIALLTDAAYVRSVAGDMDLESIYTLGIRAKMEATALSGGRRQVWENRFQWFLLAALGLMIAVLFIPEVAHRHTTPMLMLAAALTLWHPSPLSAASLHQSLRGGLEAYQQGDYQAALKHFIDAQLKAPERADIYYNIGNTHYRLGNFQEAVDNYQAAVNSRDPLLQQKALYNAGNARYRLQDLREALSDYENALRLDPEDEKARENIEFVKKIIQQQKQQKQQSSSDSKSQEDQQQTEGQSNPDDQSPNDGSERPQPRDDKASDPAVADDQQNQPGEDQPTPRFGDQMDPDQVPQPSAGDPQMEEGDENGSRAAMAAASGEPPDQNQAEAMLNRLQDKPGQAMLPNYDQKRVEKDW